MRETLEEVTLAHGVDYVDIGIPSVAVTYGSGKKKKTASYFFADRLGLQVPFLPVSEELGKPENDEFRWVSFNSLAGIMPQRLQPVVQACLNWVQSDG